jgi:hypothetical protein
MAYNSLAKRSEALAWLHRGKAVILPNWPAGGLSPTDWYDWLSAYLLLNEAIELINAEEIKRVPK